MVPKKVLSEIKQDLDCLIGSRIKLKTNKGRKKSIERSGILENTYPNIFVVRLDEKEVERRVSYSYSDILTETVELFACKSGKEIKIEGNK